MTVQLTLPADLQRFVEEQMRKGGFARSEDYLAELLRAEHKRQAKAALEAQLVAGLDNGPAIEADEAYWQRKQTDLIARHRERGR